MLGIFLLRSTFLSLGLIYPAIASLRSKDSNEFLNWAIYGIVLAFWEVLTNVFLWWFPFYYGWKSLTILWLLPTVGDGSSFLYQTFIHPLLQDVCNFPITRTSDGLRVLVENLIKKIIMDEMEKKIAEGLLGFLGIGTLCIAALLIGASR